MADEMIQPETLSKSALQELFEAAYLNVTIDDDGDLIVKERYRSLVLPDQEGRWIQVVSLFGANPAASLADKLAFVNRVNDELVLIRGYVTERGGFAFDAFIPVEGGIPKRSVVLAVRQFHHVLEAVGTKDDGDVMQ